MDIPKQSDEFIFIPDYEISGISNLELTESDQMRFWIRPLKSKTQNLIIKKNQRGDYIDRIGAAAEMFSKSVFKIENCYLDGDQVTTGREFWNHDERPQELTQIIQNAAVDRISAVEGLIKEIEKN